MWSIERFEAERVDMMAVGAGRERRRGVLRAVEGSLWDGRIEVGVRGMWCWLLWKGVRGGEGGRLMEG